MKLKKLKINTRFKNLNNFEIDFSSKEGITVLIGNNGSGKSNILEALSSVFSGLYDTRRNPNFDYELNYIKDDSDIYIKFEKGNYETKINNVTNNLRTEHLPNQVISSYSGEESRLWDTYYKPFYDDYVRALKGATLPNSRLVYIDKSYWNIALLTLHFYDFNEFTDIKDFCQDTLNIKTINFIQFSFDINEMEEWLNNPNPVTNFLITLNPNKQEIIEISLDDFKNRFDFISEIDVFRYLSASFMPINGRVITKIKININNNLESETLSEGEKKLLLLMIILEVVGDENSLILLDEPDSHIHLSRKEEIQKLLSKYTNRENIITTHSPTLTHSFEIKHIAMLIKNNENDSQIESKEKQEIIYELTKGTWSYQEQNIFLNSNNDILLVEGKSDETFLKKSLEVLKKTETRFAGLNFEYLPCGGAEGVKLMTKKFKPKPGQHIIAFFDSDQAGWNSVNKIFDRTENKYNSSNFNKYRKKEEIWIAMFPKRPFYRGGSNFNIEDYFQKALLTKYVLNEFKGLDSIVTKDKVKKNLENDCVDFDDKSFRHFKCVFDLILEIKTLQ